MHSWGGTGRDSGERSERTHRAESRLGGAKKAERKRAPDAARLGIYAVKRSCARENKGQKRDPHPPCDLNQELANAASSWFHSHTGAELAEIYQRILRANAIWCMRLGLGFKFPNRRMKPLDQAI